jgi:uncharacterized protein (TIGR00730 family)
MVFETLKEEQFLLLKSMESEYKKGMLALNSMGHHTVTFYGGSKVRENSTTYNNISELAEMFAKKGWGVITGGGPGIMSAALSGARAGKGKAIAFNIANITNEQPYKFADFSITFDIFSVRKYMLRQSDVLIYAPGGLGTLDELMENVTLMTTGKVPVKPMFLFDSKFWKGYLEWFLSMPFSRDLVEESFFKLFKVVDNYEQIRKVIFENT